LPNPEDARYDIADADAVLRDRPSRAVRSVGDALVKSDVVVTNMPGSYNQHLAAHAVCFDRSFHHSCRKGASGGP
jgi:hypothetical protein